MYIYTYICIIHVCSCTELCIVCLMHKCCSTMEMRDAMRTTLTRHKRAIAHDMCRMQLCVCVCVCVCLRLGQVTIAVEFVVLP